MSGDAPWLSYRRIAAVIQNERQYRVTQSQVKRLESALQEARAAVPAAGIPDVVREGHLNGIRFQIEDLNAELAEFERLRHGGPAAALTPIGKLEDLPTALVRARIAQGLSQRELADRLGVRAQQVQQDEAAGYARATLDRLSRIADALGVRVTGEARVRGARAGGARTKSLGSGQGKQGMEIRSTRSGR